MLTIGRLFWGLLILTSWDDALSFSLSRIFFTFPKNQDISSFFSSVSTSIKHSPEFLSDLASLSGLDGSRLQPPTGGGGQLNHLSRGNDGWEKGLLTIPFLKSNDSSSRDFNLYLNAVEGNRSIRNQKAADRGLEAAIERWWERNTLGSKGLLVYLFPAVCSQLAVLRTAVPFFLDRLSQYLQPIYMGLSFLLLQKRGAGIIQATLWSSVLIGGYFMLSDTYNAGSSWVPLQAKEDSYAVITGASSGIGLELARLLYLDGFNLILISRQGGVLEQLKADLLREQAGVDFSEIKLSEDREREERSSGYDGGNRDDYNRDRDGSSGAGVSDQNLQSTSTDTRTGSPAVKGQEPRGRKERKSGAVRCIASSTSYRSVGQYDREYIYDEDSKDFFTEDTNRREDVDVTQSGSSRQGSSRKIVTIPCDLTDQGSAIHVMSELKKLGIDDKVDVLVNNAGSAVRGPLMLSPLEDLSDTLDLNVKATVLLTRLLAPRIARRGSGGRILFVGSLSSVGPGPSVAVYAATKAFLQSFAMSLRRELMSQGVFVTLALPGAIRDTPFGLKAGAEDALVFRGPGLSLSAEDTAHDIYKGLKQGRDVVVPGLVNKLYTYLFSQILPSAAVGAITEAAWSPAPKWMPFLKPLASDLLILEEQRRQKRRMRDQVAADKAEQQRIDRLKKRELKQKSFFGFNDKSDRRGQVHRGSMASEDVGENIDDGDDWSDMNSGSNASSFSSGDALLARSRKKKNKIQMFGSSIGDSISEKKKCVAQFFKNMTTILNFPSKDEILLDGFEAPLSSRQHYRRNRTEEGESELEKKLREAIQKEREVAKREEQEEHEVGKGGISLFKKAKSKFSNWALSFWYRPVIDYSAIREWAAVPFRLKGQDIVLDEEAEEMMREHSEVESDDTVSRKMLVKRDSKGDSWDDVDFSERDREGKSDISDSSFTSDANSSPADIAVSVSVEDRCTTCDVVAATVSDNEDRVDGEKSNDGPTVVQLLAPSTTPALLPVATPVSEQSHIASAGSGGAGSFSPPYALSLRGLDLTSDSSSAFKSVVVVQPAILPVASTSLPSLHADEVDFLMQRHHVLISSGRSTSTPIVGAVGGRFSHGVNADPLCSSMLRYLSGGLLSMDEAIEDKSEFDNDGEVEGEREMEFVHEDSKYGLPSLLGGMEDICTLETTDTDNYLAGSRYDMYSGLPYNKHGRSSAVREQRAYCI